MLDNPFGRRPYPFEEKPQYINQEKYEFHFDRPGLDDVSTISGTMIASSKDGFMYVIELSMVNSGFIRFDYAK